MSVEHLHYRRYFFQVTDLRDTHFRDGRQDKFFTGTGQKLLEQSSDSTSDKKVQTVEEERVKETFEPPGTLSFLMFCPSLQACCISFWGHPE